MGYIVPCFEIFEGEPKPIRVKICSVISIFLIVFDWISDLFVIYSYFFTKSEIYYGTATILLVVLSSAVSSLISHRMYAMDRLEESEESPYLWDLRMKCRIVLLRTVFLVFPVAVLLRHLDSWKYAHKLEKAKERENRNEQEKYRKLMLEEIADVALLRVFESFLESAPQQVLQISYLFYSFYEKDDVNEGNFFTYFSAVLSFFSMALSIQTYQNFIRYGQKDKRNISFKGNTLIFFWHLFVAVSRIIMLSAMVHISWRYALTLVIIHWIVMTVCVFAFERHNFCSSPSSLKFNKLNTKERVGNFLYSSVLGLTYTFVYITPGDGDTFLRHTGFYLTCFIENIIGAATWYYYTHIPWCSVCMIVMYIVGLLFMIIYYWKFHPTILSSYSVPQSQETELAENSLNATPESEKQSVP